MSPLDNTYERKFKVIGTKPPRPDGIEKVTGRAQYGADLYVPNMLYSKILRSPHPHAKILSIDTSEAEKLDGVKAVITSKDFKNYSNNKPNDILLNCIAHDKVLYDENKHTSIASLADDVLFVTLNGLSKNYRACGYRAGWLVFSGNKSLGKDYLEGLNILASMRLCANVPGQLAIQTALGGYQSINDLVAPSGRLFKQRELSYNLMTNIPGVSCVKPPAAMYLFLKLDPKKYQIKNRFNKFNSKR